MAVSVSSGRYSKFPKVNRDVPGGVSLDPTQVEAAALEALVASLDSGGGKSDGGIPKVVIEVPELSVKKLVAWVGDDKDRRAAALEAELAGEARTTAIRALTVD